MGYYMKKPTCPRCGATVKYVIWEKGATGMLSAIANSFIRKNMLIDNVSEEKGREAGVTLTFVCQECDKHFESSNSYLL